MSVSVSFPLWGDGVCEYVVDIEYEYDEEYDDYCEPTCYWTWCGQQARYVHTFGILWDASWHEQPVRKWRRLCPEHCQDERQRYGPAVQSMFTVVEYPKVCDHTWETLDEGEPPPEFEDQARLHRAYLSQRCDLDRVGH